MGEIVRYVNVLRTDVSIPPGEGYVLSKPTPRGQMPMVKEDANESTATFSLRILSVFVVGILAIALTMGPAIAETTSVERSESVDLHTGDWLSVLSNRNSLQSVEIRGNLTAAKLAPAAHYPTSSFNLTSYAQGHYSIRLTFDWPSEYDVTILINESNAARKEIGSYYFSSGQLILTIDLGFGAPDPITPSTRASTRNDFASWTTRF